MKKMMLTTVLAAMFAVSTHAQLLWRISGNQLESASYIIGTHHLANVGFIEKIPGVKEAFQKTSQVCGELAWADMTNPDSLAYMQSQMLLPEGQTLQSLLTPEQMTRVNAALKRLMGVDMSNPMVAAQMGRMKPATLTTQMELLLFMSKHMGEFDPTSTFDQYFQTQAQKNNEPCIGLETVDFQMKTLYDKPMERQVELLMCLVDNEQTVVGMLDNLTETFYAQDLDALKKTMDIKLGTSCDSNSDEEDQLLYNRNADWLTKMPDIMKKTPTFFVVGAGHLPGDKGVLNLLRKAGYTVEGVKE
ncbi:MAG: TraB/GumN family protein [Prevotella sp.]|nr:TraB/GumN family protein [Prevotella sp.]